MMRVYVLALADSQATLVTVGGKGASLARLAQAGLPVPDGFHVTPDTLIVDKATGHMSERDTADKTVMTVRVKNGTAERPTPENLRRAPVLSDEQAAELTRLGTLIERLYKMPMDIERTLAENRFAIAQARPITALPEI